MSFSAPHCRNFLLIILVLVCLTPTASAKRKDDVVILNNGDRITGEIKSLEQGQLSFKASYMLNAVNIDWQRVIQLESKDQFVVVLLNGKFYTGVVELAGPASGSNGVFSIHQTNNSVSVSPSEVSRISPVEEDFWKQLEGTVDLGLGYTSGNDQAQLQLSSSATYRQEGYSVTTSFDTALTRQSGIRDTTRNEVALDYRKALSPKWFAGALVDFLHSSEQSLDLRTTAGGVIGRNLIRTDRTTFDTAGGLVFTRERYSAVSALEPRTYNAESVVGLNFHTYRFKTKDFSSRVLFFPSLSNPGRVRMELKSNLRIEIVKNLFLSFNAFDDFDSRPPEETKKNNLGISTSFGWKF